MRPTTFARKGSVANRRAIQLLSTRREKTENKERAGAMGQLLLSLYEHEGMTKKARALAEELTGTPSSGDGGTDDGNTGTGTVTPPPVGTTQLTRQLQAARTLLNSKPDIVAAQIESNLSRYGPAERPVALYLLGRAQQKLAGSARGAQQKQQLYRKAGLNLMRVVAYYPESRNAGMALYEAGQVCKALGNTTAAQEAWRMVLEQFPGTDAADPARKALEATR
jgi:tetratricopeptide (TPR) repeat protein